MSGRTRLPSDLIAQGPCFDLRNVELITLLLMYAASRVGLWGGPDCFVQM